MGLRRIFICGMFVALMLMAFNLASSTADASPTLRLIWHSEFSADALLLAPNDVAVDAEGNSYVSVGARPPIKKFDSEGNLVAMYGAIGEGEGEFNVPTGIALDAQGNIYVGDFNHRQIQKFDSSGNYLMSIDTEPPPGPASLGVDAQGFVYVDNFFVHAHYLQKFDGEGKLVAQWGSYGTGDGEFGNRVEDMTLDQDGNVYVADRLNHRIQKFDSEGNFLAAFGSEPSTEGNGQFTEPGGVAVDAEGNMYVIDMYFLQKLDPEGNMIAQWSTTEGGDLDRARGITAVDSQGDLYLFAYAEVISKTGETVNPLLLKKFHLE